MLWLAIHMWALLAAAFAIGLGVGWWIWGGSGSRPPQSAVSDPTMGSLDLDEDPGDTDEPGPERS